MGKLEFIAKHQDQVLVDGKLLKRNIKNRELMAIIELELSISVIAINVNGLNSLLRKENSKVGNVHLPKDCARMFIEAAFQRQTGNNPNVHQENSDIFIRWNTTQQFKTHY